MEQLTNFQKINKSVQDAQGSHLICTSAETLANEAMMTANPKTGIFSTKFMCAASTRCGKPPLAVISCRQIRCSYQREEITDEINFFFLTHIIVQPIFAC